MKHAAIVRWVLFGLCLGMFGAHCMLIGSALNQKNVVDAVFYGGLSLIWIYLVGDMMRRAMAHMPENIENYWK